MESDPWWRDRAACRGVDPEVFFCDLGDPAAVEAAVAVCRSCPVAEPCLADARRLEYGWAFGQRHGIRGGTTPQERADMDGVRVRRKPAKRADALR